MREMKDSGVPWIGKIPLSLKLIRNKYLLSYEKGKKADNTNVEQEGVPYIGASDLDSCDTAKLYTTDTALPDVIYDDVLVLWDGARAGLVGTNKVGKLSSTVVKLIPDENVVSKHFLYWYYMAFQQFMYDMVNGTTIPHMSRRFLEDIGFLSWSLGEQNQMSDYLDTKCAQIDTIIAKEQAVIEKLQEYKESIINEAVTKGVDIQVEFKPSGYDFIGDIPKSWKLLKVRYLGLLQNGISKSGNYFGHGMPFISYKDVYSSFVIPNQLDGLIESTKEEQEKYSVQSGDIFFTRTSETIDEIGISSVCKKTILYATFSGFLIRLRLINNIVSPDWAKYYFRSNHLRAYFVKEMNLVTRASLSQELLKSLPVLIPSQEEQNKIIKYLDEKCNTIYSIILKKQALIDKLTEYKKSLIYEVVTGKKEVPHV